MKFGLAKKNASAFFFGEKKETLPGTI